MIPLVKPYFPPRDELMPALEDILYSGYVATGQPVYDFEDRFKEYIGNENVISVHAGTDALHLSLILAGIKPGDEVISTPMTAEPTNTAIAMTGAKVVWGDVDPRNGLLSPESVRSHISPRTRAIMLVHYAGMVCDLDAFNAISRETGIPLIEDAAHALGSRYRARMIGCNADYTVFSLQAIKHMTTVDGGFLAMKDGSQMERARKLRWFGLSKNKSRLENDITEVGYKYAMNNVNATIGLVQMDHVRDVIATHVSNGRFYDQELTGIPGVELVPYNAHTEPSYWLYTMRVERRDDFCRAMAERGVSVSQLHHRSDTHSIFAASRRSLPGMEDWCAHFVHIPCGWWVSEEDRESIVDAVRKGW